MPAYYVAAKVQKGASVSGEALAGQRFNGVMKIKQAPTHKEGTFFFAYSTPLLILMRWVPEVRVRLALVYNFLSQPPQIGTVRYAI